LEWAHPLNVVESFLKNEPARVQYALQTGSWLARRADFAKFANQRTVILPVISGSLPATWEEKGAAKLPRPATPTAPLRHAKSEFCKALAARQAPAVRPHILPPTEAETNVFANRHRHVDRTNPISGHDDDPMRRGPQVPGRTIAPGARASYGGRSSG
jgi:hypothetical protein